MKRTSTSTFGVSKRQGHDASAFYGRQLYAEHSPPAAPAEQAAAGEPAPLATWADQIYCQSSTAMTRVPDGTVALAFTSPPYNVGKDYDEDLSFDAYLDLIDTVAREVYRVLVPGGRFVVNIANLGRKPYIPLHAHFYRVHMAAGFLPMGEIIWRKAKGASGNCAWGSWQSAKAPRLRDVHEYLLVFAKESFSRPDRGESDIERDEFTAATLSIWDIAPESARRAGHPAPFPVELAARVIHLYSYIGDVVLDPFAGSGTTCVAAAQHNRHWIGFEINPDYCARAAARVEAARQ